MEKAYLKAKVRSEETDTGENIERTEYRINIHAKSFLTFTLIVPKK